MLRQKFQRGPVPLQRTANVTRLFKLCAAVVHLDRRHQFLIRFVPRPDQFR